MCPRVQILEPNQTCDGVAQKNMGLCRMDIMYSVLGYLGYDATESYGITWKVVLSAWGTFPVHSLCCLCFMYPDP